jgi:hypothetical protein
MKFICAAGQMRSGKNVTGEYLCGKSGFLPASFAKPVKDIYCRAFGVDMDFVEKWKVINEPPPGFDKTVRQSLQFIGDGFRSINPNVWVDYAFSNNPEKSCYMDGRYLNELSRVRLEGGANILLWRPRHENNDSNQSEAQVKPLVDWYAERRIEGEVGMLDRSSAPKGCELVDFFLINDGDIPSLYRKIDRLVIPKI